MKIFIYNMKGDLIKEYFYEDFVYALNEVLDHNKKNKENKYNFIHGEQFPPKGLLWSKEYKDWMKDKNQPYVSIVNFMEFFN